MCVTLFNTLRNPVMEVLIFQFHRCQHTSGTGEVKYLAKVTEGENGRIHIETEAVWL